MKIIISLSIYSIVSIRGLVCSHIPFFSIIRFPFHFYTSCILGFLLSVEYILIFVVFPSTHSIISFSNISCRIICPTHSFRLLTTFFRSNVLSAILFSTSTLGPFNLSFTFSTTFQTTRAFFALPLILSKFHIYKRLYTS